MEIVATGFDQAIGSRVHSFDQEVDHTAVVDENGELVLEKVEDPVAGEVTLEPVVIVGPSNSLEVDAVEGAKPCGD